MGSQFDLKRRQVSRLCEFTLMNIKYVWILPTFAYNHANFEAKLGFFVERKDSMDLKHSMYDEECL